MSDNQKNLLGLLRFWRLLAVFLGVFVSGFFLRACASGDSLSSSFEEVAGPLPVLYTQKELEHRHSSLKTALLDHKDLVEVTQKEDVREETQALEDLRDRQFRETIESVEGGRKERP